MTFSNTIDFYGSKGNKRVTQGSFTSDTTGGNIDTGLLICEFIQLRPISGTSPAVDCAVNETLPIAGNAITIVTTSGVDGYWEAIGY